ncbi:MAG: hypothetical protein IJJ23_09335 [Clostridia bacterium]|nr:hypothetical protein [Clostridia bacterium]
MDRQILEAARQALTDVTPMNHDCGRHCGAACCQPDEEGHGGMFLFPGEEALIDPALRVSDAMMGSIKVKMAECEGACRRDMRPLGCMIFPLTAETNADGSVYVRFDVRARPLCPLMKNGLMGIRRDFRDAVSSALSLIASDPEGRAFLTAWEDEEDKYVFKL